MPRRLLIFCLWLVLSGTWAADANNTLGEHIYLQGMIDANISVTARTGFEALAEGPAVACVNCHGDRAEGKPDAWGSPPAINWSRLSRPLGELRKDGSLRPPYDEKKFIRIITQGVDAGGRALATDMPRFELRDEEIKSLMAYLKQIDKKKEQNGSQKLWRLGSFIAPGAPELAQQAIQSLQMCVKANPAMFGHPLELKLYEFGPGQSVASMAKQLAATPDLLALVAPVIAGSELALLSAMSAVDVPVIGPIAMVTPEEPSASNMIYFLFGGLREETQALSDQLAKGVSGNGRLWVVHTDDGLGQQLMQTARRAAHQVNSGLAVEAWPLGHTSNLINQHEPSFQVTDALLMLAPVGLPQASELMENLPSHLAIGMPWMYLVGSEQRWAERISLVSYPWLAGQKSAGSLYARWGRLSCELALESLRRAGEQPTSLKLAKALESIDGFAGSDDMPGLRFSFDRHVGARGVFLAPLDTQHMPAVDKSRWVELDKIPAEVVFPISNRIQ